MLRATRRLALTILGIVAVVVTVAAVTWLLLYALRPNLFPDHPSAPKQLADFLERAFLHLDFDRSQAGSEREVTLLMREGLPADLALLAGGLVFGLGLGVAVGLYSGMRRRTFPSRVVELLAAVAISTPVFVFGLWALLLFGKDIGDIAHAIPLEYVPFSVSPARWLESIVVPWIVLALPLAGLCVRVMSSSTAETLATDHVLAAEARGVGRRRMVFGHVLPVAVAPTLALASASANILLINLVVVERVFDIPGFMREVVGSVRDADVPLLLALSIVSAAIIALVSVLLGAVVDRLDPRARAAR